MITNPVMQTSKQIEQASRVMLAKLIVLQTCGRQADLGIIVVLVGEREAVAAAVEVIGIQVCAGGQRLWRIVSTEPREQSRQEQVPCTILCLISQGLP